MASKKKAYLHTINGHPARYIEGTQIVYLITAAHNVLRSSLKEIRADQRATEKWRKQQGFRADAGRYGYRMFYL